MYVVETCIFDETDYLPYCFRSLDDALAIAAKTMQKQCKAHQKLMEKDEEAKGKVVVKKYDNHTKDNTESRTLGYLVVFKNDQVKSDRGVVLDYAFIHHFTVK